MISVYQLKPAFQRLLRPLAGRLAAAGVSANQVTVAAALLSFAHGCWIALAPQSAWPLLLLPLTLLVRMALNAIDGMLAREFDQQSRLGALLNELADVLSDVALYLPLALLDGVSAAAVVAAIIASLLAEFAGVCALLVGSERRYDGPMGKSDRAFVFGNFGLLFGLAWISAPIGSGLAWLVALLALVTLVRRARKALEVGT
jgi:CDP-diacylglycerol--glycerol-3-phosphate 3-phosphatidyltransferase